MADIYKDLFMEKMQLPHLQCSQPEERGLFLFEWTAS